MKKLALTFLFTWFIAWAGFSAPGGIAAYLSHSSFQIPGQGPYFETYLEVLGNSIVYKQNDAGKFQGSVQITMVIRQDSVIRDFRKYELFSPELDDTIAIGINFIDQQRFTLANGSYTLDLTIADMNFNRKPAVISYPVEINFPSDNYSVSGIQLVSSFKKTEEPNILSKSGYDFVPFADNFYPSDKTKLTFYAEIYNPGWESAPDAKFLASMYIESYETGKMLNDFVRIRKETSKPVIVILSEFDITKLASGNYNLVVNLRNSSNEIVAQNYLFFQRSNPGMENPLQNLSSLDASGTFAASITNADTLREYVRSLQPIATELENIFIRSQTETASPETLRQFLYRFWLTRNELNPQKAWEDYNYQVKVVNQAYTTQVKKGYNTDMGRVYLRYGPPNTITDVPFDAGGMLSEPSVPYQIWHYYSINNNRERNKKFVFIASELRVKDYTLVHSDVNGEIQNYNWQAMLGRRLGVDDMDADQFKRDRGRSSTYYRDPY